ncbi:hypothetical protein NKG94_02840 [Micromonospora sp. M12]
MTATSSPGSGRSSCRSCPTTRWQLPSSAKPMSTTPRRASSCGAPTAPRSTSPGTTIPRRPSTRSPTCLSTCGR